MLWCCMIAIVHVICNTSYSREERGGHDVGSRRGMSNFFRPKRALYVVARRKNGRRSSDIAQGYYGGTYDGINMLLHICNQSNDLRPFWTN